MRNALVGLAGVLIVPLGMHANLTGQGNQPRIHSLSPSSAVAGDKAFRLTVIGENFGQPKQDAAVRWNGIDRPTTYVSATELRLELTAEDLAHAGTARVSVYLPIGGGMTSAEVPFTINNPTPTISSLSPAVAAAGEKSPVVLSVSGSAFAEGAQVHWNGKPRPTNRTSATLVTGTLSAADLSAAGTGTVTVVNPAPGGGASAGRAFRVVELPAITAFYIGGPNNPARVWAARTVPLHVARSGGTPTHWRVAPSAAALQTAAWQATSRPMSHTFDAWRADDCGLIDPSTYRREHELHVQFATVIGTDTLSSASRSDPVVVRLPWCTPVRINTPLGFAGFPSGTLQYALCPVGQVMTGIRARLVSIPVYGDVVTAVGPVCAGRDRPLVGTTRGRVSRTDYGATAVPALSVLPGEVQTLKAVLPLPVPSPGWLNRTSAYDPLYTAPVGGRVSGGSPSGSSWDVRCGANAVPIGLGVYRNGPQGPSIGIGLVCVRQD
jgi:hypothetical protein